MCELLRYRKMGRLGKFNIESWIAKHYNFLEKKLGRT
jgi:hypothetical protein